MTEPADWRDPEELEGQLAECWRRIEELERALAQSAEAEKTAMAAVTSAFADRERMIYWLLRAHVVADVDDSYAAQNLREGIERLLRDLGYPIYGDRATQMLTLGEPGK